ncbi:ATP-binding cassette domain-containing protein [Parabacteroides sp. OttesenSCG-928-N08]|nr:ATP-binding cassette domain-containing protein [Parabacteroides sp. OttesenSCG-928-N08]
MSILLQNISYIHPDNALLFQQVSFSVNRGEKIALVGRNGCGKSTLFRIIIGETTPTTGTLSFSETPYCVPQHFGQYDHQSVAEALRVSDKLRAFHAILEGDASEENFSLLADDWGIEERCQAALSMWNLSHIDLCQAMSTLSGGEKTKVFLAGLAIHEPAIVLLDEPTNHLDRTARQLFYDWITESRATLFVVSHDVTLLRQLTTIYELTPDGIAVYGGNYDLYKEQKEQGLLALQSQLEEKEKALRLAKKVAREAAERKQKHEVRGKKKKEQQGVGKMAMDTLQDKAEKSAAKLKEVHAEKSAAINDEIKRLRAELPEGRGMKVDFNSSSLHSGKQLVRATAVNFGYLPEQLLWTEPLTFVIRSGDRLVIRGDNGSGKSTLIKLITGQLSPTVGTIDCATFSHVYIDQDYSLIDDRLTLYDQAQQYNRQHYPEHEVKTILNRYLFPYDTWDKPCGKLSGGEKMRLLFCCLMIGNQKPDLFILDEPTNNLDIQNIEIIAEVIRNYRGTLLLISHDAYFIEQAGVDLSLEL